VKALKTKEIEVPCVIYCNEDKCYYESSAGQSKACYWTDKLADAKVFTSATDAAKKLPQLRRTGSISILEVIEEELSDIAIESAIINP